MPAAAAAMGHAPMGTTSSVSCSWDPAGMESFSLAAIPAILKAEMPSQVSCVTSLYTGPTLRRRRGAARQHRTVRGHRSATQCEATAAPHRVRSCDSPRQQQLQRPVAGRCGASQPSHRALGPRAIGGARHTAVASAAGAAIAIALASPTSPHHSQRQATTEPHHQPVARALGLSPPTVGASITTPSHCQCCEPVQPSGGRGVMATATSQHRRHRPPTTRPCRRRTRQMRRCPRSRQCHPGIPLRRCSIQTAPP